MKSIHFTLDLYQLFEFTGHSHILEFLSKHKTFSPHIWVFYLRWKKETMVSLFQNSPSWEQHQATNTEALQSTHWSKLCRLRRVSANLGIIIKGLKKQNSVEYSEGRTTFQSSLQKKISSQLKAKCFVFNKGIYSLMTGNFFAYNPRQVLKQGILLEKVSQRYTCPDDGRKIKREIIFQL